MSQPPTSRTVPRESLGSAALVIDTDAGIDDVVALALAARSPDITIAAVTTTYGNAGLPETTRNAHTVLELAGRSDVPVYPGAERPLVRPRASGAAMHGPTGVGYAAVSPAPAVPAEPDVLLSILGALAPPVTLLTLGPLTNLAHALARDAGLVRRAVHRHVAMLGAFAQRGAPDRLADFNAWADPEAADTVLRAGLPTSLVPLDVTRRMLLTPDEVARLQQSRDPLARWLGDALRYSVEAHQRIHGISGCAVHDVLPVGEVLAAGILTLAPRRLAVDLDEGIRRGHTREREEGALIEVATSADEGRMRALLASVLVV